MENENNVPKDVPLTASDYRDLDMERLQIIADYIGKKSVPQGMTIAEAQEVIAAYSDLLNLSLYNLNLLRSLAGEEQFPIPGGER